LLSHERAAGRELFGEKALALKRGQLSLAIEKGRVVAVERN
jgi:ribonuclease D